MELVEVRVLGLGLGLGNPRELLAWLASRLGVGARVEVWVRRGTWEMLGRGLGVG